MISFLSTGTHSADILSYHPSSYLSGIIYAGAFPYVNAVQQAGQNKLSEVVASLLTPTIDVDSFQKAAQAFVSGLIHKQDATPYRLRQALIGDIVLQPRIVAIRAVTRKQDEQSLLKAGKEGSLRVLVLTGKDDVESITVKALGEWKKIEVAEIEDAGHMMFADQPDKFMENILAWIKKA